MLDSLLGDRQVQPYSVLYFQNTEKKHQDSQDTQEGIIYLSLFLNYHTYYTF